MVQAHMQSMRQKILIFVDDAILSRCNNFL